MGTLMWSWFGLEREDRITMCSKVLDVGRCSELNIEDDCNRSSRSLLLAVDNRVTSAQEICWGLAKRARADRPECLGMRVHPWRAVDAVGAIQFLFQLSDTRTSEA